MSRLCGGCLTAATDAQLPIKRGFQSSLRFIENGYLALYDVIFGGMWRETRPSGLDVNALGRFNSGRLRGNRRLFGERAGWPNS
jgi:hypothetical protein